MFSICVFLHLQVAPLASSRHQAPSNTIAVSTTRTQLTIEIGVATESWMGNFASYCLWDPLWICTTLNWTILGRIVFATIRLIAEFMYFNKFGINFFESKILSEAFRPNANPTIIAGISFSNRTKDFHLPTPIEIQRTDAQNMKYHFCRLLSSSACTSIETLCAEHSMFLFVWTAWHSYGFDRSVYALTWHIQVVTLPPIHLRRRLNCQFRLWIVDCVVGMECQ